jgi:hypothetical protein
MMEIYTKVNTEQVTPPLMALFVDDVCTITKKPILKAFNILVFLISYYISLKK